MSRPHGPRWLPVLTVSLLLAILSIGAATVAAQQPNQLYISVLDDKGQPVTDLTAADFTVTVDGAEAKIVKVEPVSKPTKLTVMIDNGQATTKELASFRTAFKNLIAAVPEGIQIELITFAPQPRWLEKATADHQKLTSAVDRIAPDSGAGLFFDALVEAGSRAEKEKGAFLPIFLMLASDFGRNSSSMDRDWEKLQKQVIQYGITVHFVMFHSGGDRAGSVAGAIKTEIGLAITKLSGGRYENIATSQRLVTLMPELGKTFEKSNVRQMNQLRITYEAPKGSKPGAAGQQIGASLKTTRTGLQPQLSIDGKMPTQ